MRWATVMYYDTKQSAYKLLLRSGSEEWCTATRLDDEFGVTQYSTFANVIGDDNVDYNYCTNG